MLPRLMKKTGTLMRIPTFWSHIESKDASSEAPVWRVILWEGVLRTVEKQEHWKQGKPGEEGKGGGRGKVAPCSQWYVLNFCLLLCQLLCVF